MPGGAGSTGNAGNGGNTTGSTGSGWAGTRVAVIYFSCTGNTRTAAERIRDLTGADLIELVPEQPYTSQDLDYNDESCRANQEQKDPAARPRIAGPAAGPVPVWHHLSGLSHLAGHRTTDHQHVPGQL